jgi:anti-sigma regulatory factor (Ser/Thr protein kinase)
VTLHRRFRRHIDSLEAIFEFSAAALQHSALSETQRRIVDFTLEELFTNMVKYGSLGAPEVSIEIECAGEGAVVTLLDADVEPFDVTLAPDAPVDLPIEERVPGGLGLHVVRPIDDAQCYDYDASAREARTRFWVGGARDAQHVHD